MNKKNSIVTTIAILLASCTTLKQPSETELFALNKAEKYSKTAQISYLKCSYQWPNEDCLQHNWSTYGTPEIKTISQEEWKSQALVFIRSMEMLGAANVLRDNGYQCSKIHYFDSFIFVKGKHAICDSGFEYKIKLKGAVWRIDVLATPENEVQINGIKKQ